MMKSRNEKSISPFFKFILAAISALCFIGAVVVRFVQLYKFTDSTTGRIKTGYENSVILLWALVLAFVLAISLLLPRSKVKNPFGGGASRPLQICSFIAGAALFYDFARQCLNCYYYFQSDYFEYVYLFFVGFNALLGLVSAFYFFTVGASFNTPNYNFSLLGFLHIAPFLWAFSRLLYCLSIIVNPFYSQEDVLSFALIVVLTLFFMQYLLLVDSPKAKPALTAGLGFIYAFLAVSISLPRLVLYFFDIELYEVYYSAVTYFFTGIFVFAFSLSTIISDRKV